MVECTALYANLTAWLTLLAFTPPAGVHIADVTNFVHPGTAMDEEASAR